jgi:drug/metabolite transporter (DMT)-like permease
MAISGRAISFQLDTFEIMTYRSIIGLIIVIIIGSATGKINNLRFKKLKLHFFRNLVHFIGQNLWFFALALIPFAQLFAFEFSVPIWVAICAPFFLSEKLTPIRIGAAIVGFCGILLVARPGIEPISIGIIAAAGCSLMFAFTSITTKILTRTEEITDILFWLTSMQLVFGIICAGYDGDIKLPNSSTLPWLIIIGCCGLLAHFSLTKALTYAPATVVTPMDFGRLPIIAIIGMVFYDEPLSLFVILGALVIFLANYVNIRGEAQQNS